MAKVQNQESLQEQQDMAKTWFLSLRDQICLEFEQLERELSTGPNRDLAPANFVRKSWERDGGGGGEISLMHGRVFEKVGVNISTVYGEFSEQFRKEMPGANENPNFWASGISLVAHMHNPKVPAVHFNTRFVVTTKSWFGGGGDLTPMVVNEEDKAHFHRAFKEACDKHDSEYYPKFKKQCDEYFYLHHRSEPRGIGGIFYDYHNTGSFERDLAFTQDVGLGLINAYVPLVRKHMHDEFTQEDREHQLRKRGRYVEFNLLYDRGTRFGLMTGGNVEAILMSLPPIVKW